MTHRFVGVESVDVQQVDRVIGKLRKSIVKASAQQIGELPVVALVVLAYLIKDFFTILSGMLITLPMIDGIAQATKSTFLNCLAKGEVGFAPMSTQFNDEVGMCSGNQVAGKGKVA